MTLQSKFREALRIWNQSGVAGVRARIEWNKTKAAEREAYVRWLQTHGSPDAAARQEMRLQIRKFETRPLVSVLLPVYNVDEKWLRLCIDSVLGQVYENWELCIADDCSPGPHVRRVLDEYAALDPRIKVVYRETNGHISAASNSALELAAGEFVVLLDHDDELSPDALFWVASELNEFPETAMIYSDEDMIDTAGRRSKPKFKPDFSRDLLYSLNLVTHLSAYSTKLMRSIGGFRIGFEGSQDYDVALRVVEQISEKQIRHIPRVLYHWRAIEGSVALSSDEKPYAHERARNAIREHLTRAGIAATIVETHYNLHRVRYDLPEPAPPVSLVVHGKVGPDHERQLAESTEYPDFKIIAADDHAVGRASRLNTAVRACSGLVVVFVEGGLVPRDRDWLTELVRFAVQPGVGAVGGKILGRDETVVAGALVIGADGSTAPAHYGYPRDIAGNMGRNQVVGNFSAVSESCLAVTRADLESAGGFDEVNLPNALFAADLCLRLGETNGRIVLTPYAELIRQDQSPDPRPAVAELEYFKKRWPQYVAADPFYNPNLSRRDATFSIDA